MQTARAKTSFVLSFGTTRKGAPSIYQAVTLHHGDYRSISSQRIHTSAKRAQPSAMSTSHISGDTNSTTTVTVDGSTKAVSTLAALPLSQILRTYFITSVSSSPLLLGASTSLLRRMLDSRNPLFRLDKNPVMRALLWETFYKQFCSGETSTQVSTACSELRAQGYSGVILEYALEVLKDAEGNEAEDVAVWRKGLLETVEMAAPGDFVGLKWSGMGSAAMRLMAKNEQPTERMSEAMHALCSAAQAKNVWLLPAAEETWSLEGFNNWCIEMQRAYNTNGKSVVYCTYQAYLHQTPANLAQHMELARKEGFTLGVKLVRGAYLSTDDRSKIHATIEGTHRAYDEIASALIHRRYNATLQAPVAGESQDLPPINVMLATHNAASVSHAQSLRRTQRSRGEELTPLVFAQLQGMADEVSCSLVATAKQDTGASEGKASVQESVLKCTTWGPMGDCLNYLLRRAAENKDAASRTKDTRNAMGIEIRRRLKGVVGLI